jgi:hypothetical protein
MFLVGPKVFNLVVKGVNQKLPLKSNNVEFCGIVAAILKMATGRNFSMSGINSGHHNLQR